MPCHIVPPTAPIAKALPKSDRMTQGLVLVSATARRNDRRDQLTKDHVCGLHGPLSVSGEGEDGGGTERKEGGGGNGNGGDVLDVEGNFQAPFPDMVVGKTRKSRAGRVVLEYLRRADSSLDPNHNNRCRPEQSHRRCTDDARKSTSTFSPLAYTHRHTQQPSQQQRRTRLCIR